MKQDCNENKRPSSYNEKVEKYLDILRDSNGTNMFGASPYLKKHFSMTKKESDACLIFWMLSFSNR